MGANIQETKIAFGFKKQSNLATANILAEMWRLNKINSDLFSPGLTAEDDAEEIGKGNEFATATFPVAYDSIAFPIEKFLSSQFIAWVTGFGLGISVKTGAGPFVYTNVPLDAETDGIEMPSFSYIQAIRQGGSAVTDVMAVGNIVDSFLISIGSGPGRANSRVVANIVGSGKLTDPSAITIPAKTAEIELPSAGLALTINGTDYVTNKNIISLEWGFANNFRGEEGFFPGSGVQDGAAIRGRMEFNRRVATLNFVARFVNGSTELATLKDLTTGTAVITQGTGTEKYTATFHQVGFRAVVLGESGGLVTVSVECSPQFHSSNGLMTVVCDTAFDDIMQ